MHYSRVAFAESVHLIRAPAKAAAPDFEAESGLREVGHDEIFQRFTDPPNAQEYPSVGYSHNTIKRKLFQTLGLFAV